MPVFIGSVSPTFREGFVLCSLARFFFFDAGAYIESEHNVITRLLNTEWKAASLVFSTLASTQGLGSGNLFKGTAQRKISHRQISGCTRFIAIQAIIAFLLALLSRGEVLFISAEMYRAQLSEHIG